MKFHNQKNNFTFYNCRKQNLVSKRFWVKIPNKVLREQIYVSAENNRKKLRLSSISFVLTEFFYDLKINKPFSYIYKLYGYYFKFNSKNRECLSYYFKSIGFILFIAIAIYIFVTYNSNSFYDFFNYKALDWNIFNSTTEGNANQVANNIIDENNTETDTEESLVSFFKSLTLKEQIGIITVSLSIAAIYFYFDPNVEIPSKIIRYLLSKKEN